MCIGVYTAIYLYTFYVHRFLFVCSVVGYLSTLYTAVSSVGVATGYMVEGQGSIPGRRKRFFLVSERPHRLWAHLTLYQKDTWVYFI
jgi:hypothetical protein